MSKPSTLHVLSLATLFPDQTRPNFGIFVEKSLAALSRQPGVELTVIAPLGMPPWPLSRHRQYRPRHDIPPQETWHGLTVLRPRFSLVPKLGGILNGGAIARAVLPLARALQAQGRLDVIDAEFFHPDGFAAMRLAQALDVPFSIKARGNDISLWSARRDTGPGILRAARAADGMLAVSAALRDDMIAVGMPGERISVHYTGLDAEQFRPGDQAAARAAWGLPADAQIMLTVGALIPRKGQMLVVEALALLPPHVHYVMAGAGEDGDRLRARAAELGLAARVHLLGAVPHARMPELNAVADVMVLPSASEGLANAWVEALACGVPLVLSDIPPAREILDIPHSGQVAGKSPAAIADAVSTVLADPPKRDQLSAQVHQRFCWQRNGAELAMHLRRLAGRF